MSNVFNILKGAVVLTVNYFPGRTAETDQRFNVNLFYKIRAGMKYLAA